MARTPAHKPMADAIIGGRERSLLAEIATWLKGKGAKVGQSFTERNFYQEVASMRGERNKARRSAAQCA